MMEMIRNTGSTAGGCNSTDHPWSQRRVCPLAWTQPAQARDVLSSRQRPQLRQLRPTDSPCKQSCRKLRHNTFLPQSSQSCPDNKGSCIAFDGSTLFILLPVCMNVLNYGIAEEGGLVEDFENIHTDCKQN